MFPTTTTTINTANRKRSRRTLQQQQGSTPVKMSSVVLAMTLLLLAISQASAFGASSASLRSKTVEIPNASMEAGKIERFEYYEEEEMEDEIDYDEDFEEDDEEEEEEDDFEEEEDIEEDEQEDKWTYEEHLLMDRLYSRYVQQLVHEYGENWEEEYELTVDKEELYEEFLKFEDKEKAKIEEKRQLIQATHKVLLEYDGSINSIEKNDCYNVDLQNSTEGVRGNNNSNMEECSNTPTPMPTTIITTRMGNARNMIGPI